MKSGKGKSKPQQQPQPPPPPLSQKNSMKRQTTTIIMRIIEVIIEVTDPIGVNTVVENHTEDPKIGEGDNKIIIGTNTKATVDNLTTPAVAVTIITMAIIEAEVVMAMVEIILDVTVAGEAIIEAIIITNTINITHMMMDDRSNNMAHHVYVMCGKDGLLSCELT